MLPVLKQSLCCPGQCEVDWAVGLNYSIQMSYRFKSGTMNIPAIVSSMHSIVNLYQSIQYQVCNNVTECRKTVLYKKKAMVIEIEINYILLKKCLISRSAGLAWRGSTNNAIRDFYHSY